MSTIWDRTTEFLDDNRGALAPVVLFGLFVPLGLLGTLMPLMRSGGTQGDWALGLIVLLMALVTSWAGLVITALAFDPGGGRAAAVALANRRLLPVLGIGVVTLLAVFVLTLPIGIILGMSGMDMTALSSGRMAPNEVNGGALLIATFYAFVLGLLLFWAYARLVVLIPPIMLLERRGLGVYRRAFNLTRHIAWKVIGMLLLYFLLSWVASMAARTVFGTIFALLIGGEGTITLASVLTQFVVAAVSTLFSLLAAVFVAKLYLAVRETPEAIVTAS
ncbi:hypothetical protein U1872_17190 [Sphingomonas sp. RB3P16]|uniref:hypothetical protein n=1 Tax=Parasphingomonas frigoris TaxID=3096163 RepID=UPI002FC90C35